MKSKLQPMTNGLFRVLEKINDNAYKIDLCGEYQVNATFSVSDLSPYDVGNDNDDELNLRTNFVQEEGEMMMTTLRDAKEFQELEVEGLLTRGKDRKLKAQLEQQVVSYLS